MRVCVYACERERDTQRERESLQGNNGGLVNWSGQSEWPQQLRVRFSLWLYHLLSCVSEFYDLDVCQTHRSLLKEQMSVCKMLDPI